MQEKIKVLTIGDYQSSILENHFKDNENIEFLELSLNESIEKLNNKLSNRDIVFLRSNGNNFETLLEIGKALKEKEIITVTILEEKLVIENKEILEKHPEIAFEKLKNINFELAELCLQHHNKDVNEKMKFGKVDNIYKWYIKTPGLLLTLE